MPKSVFTDAYSLLVEMLVEARRAQGMSQVELARRLGKPQPFVSYVERGERRIDVIEFYAFMRALDLDPTAQFAALAERLPSQVEI